MKILVTGAAGFIGTNLLKSLLSDGHKIVALDNFITGSRENIRKLSSHKNLKFFEQDITKTFPDSLNSQLSNLNSIYHLACPTGVPNLVPLAEEMILTCSIGTKNVLEIARNNKANLVFTSSSETYGDPKVTPQAEKYTGNVDPIGIRSPYEEGKRFSESMVSTYVRKYNLDAKIVRVFNTYGPYMSPHDTRVIPNFLRQAIVGERLTIQGKGTQRRTFCFVNDLVVGLMLIMDKGQKGEVYNLGGEEEISIGDLAQLVLRETRAKSQTEFVQRPMHDHESRMPDLAKVKALGWSQSIPLVDGLRKTIESGFPPKY